MSTEYSNDEVTVVWDKTKCTHAAFRARQLPRVFKPKEPRWIQVEGASAQEIIDQVGKCPSGAISIKK
ncbi:MAG: (4Fe-4S)-binding protein [Crocinitomicaceae bacterium]|jgi:uncharacterized Fe-S cluster protein YjdI|nr:(4Fe-4S)-binding protein [Crocinitomicaceae bacterium]MDG1658913.1 (4Fe-4S)-binding protein [Crocinitomicaceae bacterium]